MLDANIKQQLQAFLQRLVNPIVLRIARDESGTSKEMSELLEEIALLNDKISIEEDQTPNVRRPSFTISQPGKPNEVRFAAIPLGHEFTSLVLALLQMSGYPPKIPQDLQDRISGLKKELNFEVFMSLSCHNCPDVVQSLNAMAALNPNVKVTTIDGALFQDEVKERKVMAVPLVMLNGENFISGRRELAEIIEKLDESYAQDVAAQISEKAPFDVLVIGAGPAGSTAAIYAARKGLRTGIVCERPGGQVNETAEIENFTSIVRTQGPRLGADLMSHVTAYGIDVMAPQRVAGLRKEDGLWVANLTSGGTVRTKTLIVATGARWRELKVPGEARYRGKGVAYCPHCDGPLFKGKDVVVCGGGNSGVEAAIDLAGICRSVTLIQRGPKLTADEVLQNRLLKTPNIKVVVNTTITELEGNAESLTGVRYIDKTTGESRFIPASGCFVQIGLVPNTEWISGVVELNKYNEIIIDNKCATSTSGIFAAGDCTDVPYKQIVIGLGEGAKASLSAFDWLIRQ